MDWYWLVFVVVAVVFVVNWVNRKSGKNQASFFNLQSRRQRESMASDRQLILELHRRELANYLISNDPDRFRRLYHKACELDSEIRTADKERRSAELTIITKKYPFYEDFDLLGTREHILYADAFRSYEIEDIEEHYLTLIRFHSLMKTSDEDWSWRSDATNEKNEDHLDAYVRKIKDTRFLQRMQDAIDQYYSVERGSDFKLPEPNHPVFSNRDFEIYYVPHIAENRYGIVFKDTGECGLYGSFYDDDRDKTYRSFYRSDRKFAAEEYLDHLRIDARI